MARYLATTRGHHAKTHLLTGHHDFFVTACGIVYRRQTYQFRELLRVRVPGNYRHGRPADMDLYPTVTCRRCKERGVPSFFERSDPGSERNTRA